MKTTKKNTSTEQQGTYEKRPKPKVTCDWVSRNIVHVDPDGQVHPCCYFANAYYRSLYNEGEGHLFKMIPQYREYQENPERFNVDTRSVVDISKDEWFNETLEASWESWKTLPQQCRQHCCTNNPQINVHRTPLGSFGQQFEGGEAIGWKKKKDKEEELANIAQHWNGVKEERGLE